MQLYQERCFGKFGKLAIFTGFTNEHWDFRAHIRDWEFMGSGALKPRRIMPEPPLLSSSPASPLHHTEAEIIAALDALSDTDIRYLVGFARYRILGLRGKADEADADDLFSEAVTQTLNVRRNLKAPPASSPEVPARRRGIRKWKRGVSFRNHLIACMRSNANSRFKRASRNVELPPEHPAPSSDPEHVLDAITNVKRLRDHLREDAVADEVLTTLLDGFSPKLARELLHMRPEVYEAARKRIRRLAEKLLGSQKKTPHA